MTWYVNMLVKVALFSGLTRLSTVPAGRAANASFVGAKTVNGPLLFSVSTRPAAFTAATSVVWSAELTALSTISLLGYIAWPPTITVSASANALDAATDSPAIRTPSIALFMTISSLSRARLRCHEAIYVALAAVDATTEGPTRRMDP